MWSQILSRNPACSHCPARSSPSPARLQVYPGHFRRSLASRIQLPSPFPVAVNQHGKAGSGSRGLRSGNPLRGGVLRCCTCNACQCAARKPLHPNHPPRSGPLFQGAGREAACPPFPGGAEPCRAVQPTCCFALYKHSRPFRGLLQYSETCERKKTHFLTQPLSKVPDETRVPGHRPDPLVASIPGEGRPEAGKEEPPAQG